jgi:hypothetical protein
MCEDEPLPPLEIAYIVQHHTNPLGLTHFHGIGAMPAKGTIHLDTRPMPDVTWVQRGRGAYEYGVDFEDLVCNVKPIKET